MASDGDVGGIGMECSGWSVVAIAVLACCVVIVVGWHMLRLEYCTSFSQACFTFSAMVVVNLFARPSG